MKAICAVTLATLACSGGPVLADIVQVHGFETGNELYDACVNDTHFCYGFIEAIADAMSGRFGVQGWYACIDQQVIARQIYDVVVEYLRDNPTSRHLGADGLVAHALSLNFPCKN
jgi:hypothetical protein